MHPLTSITMMLHVDATPSSSARLALYRGNAAAAGDSEPALKSSTMSGKHWV